MSPKERAVVNAAMSYFRDYHQLGYAPRNLNISPKRRALFAACQRLAKTRGESSTATASK